jgi:peptidoglycan/xylan/chitin deacetylase (PgdA/CDA1 family)
VDQKAFAREIYMDEDQVRCLVDAGMMVGSHGYNHDWLNHLDPIDQALEIDRSLEFLERVGVGTTDWAMCYPYGGWSTSLLEILRARKCAVAFTTEVDIADLTQHDPLLLPRLDTNDLPKAAQAEAAAWTLKAIDKNLK